MPEHVTAGALARPDDLVVVALGAVSPYGHGVPALWDGIMSGATAIRPLGWDVGLDGRWIAGWVPDRRPGTGADDPVVAFALAATREARAGVTGDLDGATWGVVFGSCNGGLATAEDVLAPAGLAGEVAPERVADLLWLSPQAVAEAVAASLGARGPVHSVNTACASGAHALMHGADLLRRGSCDLLLAGGADGLSRIALVGFTRLGALAAEPARPYAANRAGMSLGEGAAALVLCLRSTAEVRGLPVLATLRGVGASADGHHLTDPHPQGLGAGRAIRAALRAADVKAEQVGYVNGHGTGTPKNDVAEDAAITLGLGAGAAPVPLSSTKSMTGHLLGAAGALEAVVVVEALRRGVRPPSLGLDDGVDPRLRARVVRTPEEADLEVALSNSFAFGGANACLAIGRPRATGAEEDLDDVVVTGCAVTAADDTEPLVPDLGDLLPRRVQQRTDRAGLLVVASALPALLDAGLEASEAVGLFVGTGFGPAENLEAFLREVLTSPATGGSPRRFPNTVYNAPAGHALQLCGLRGPTSTLTGNLAADLSAFALAYESLARGRAEAILVTGLEVSSSTALAVAARFGDDVLLREASATVVLERRSRAVARGARVLATVRGHGGAFGRDAWRRAFEAALADSTVEGATVWLGPHAEPAPAVLAGLRADPRVGVVDRTRDLYGAHGGASTLVALATSLAGPARDVEGLVLTAASGTGAHVAVLLERHGTPPRPTSAEEANR